MLDRVLPRRAALVALLPLLGACAHRAPVAERPAPAAAPALPAPPDVPPVDDRAIRAINARLLADSAEEAPPPEPRYALDVDVSPYESHDRVARFVGHFSGAGREAFLARLERGTRYEPMIRAQLRAAGLPEDLYYLALVESGFDPHAVSRASAVGMWQFMAPTARHLGLRVDWWVDERRDPVRSTDAAVRNLRWLRKEFGSLFLAAAAYNGGPGRVARGLAQLAALSDSAVGETRFFALAEGGLLHEETSNYVPQIIAAALVAGEPVRYGIVPRRLPAFAYDTVRVRALTPLAAVARAADASRDALLDLNPQLLRGMTPPGEPTLVRVPVGAAAGFASRLAALPAAERRAFHGVRTKTGETVEKIAAREQVPVAELRRYNPGLRSVKKGKRKGTLVAGQVVRVPSAELLAYARPVGEVDGEGPSGLPVPTVAAAAASAKSSVKSKAKASPTSTGSKAAKAAASRASAKAGVTKSAARKPAAKSTAAKAAAPESKSATKAKSAAQAKSATKAKPVTKAKAASRPAAAKAAPKAKPSAEKTSRTAAKKAAS